MPDQQMPMTSEDLTAHLAATLGNDVERAMESVGWKATEYTPQVPQDNPDAQQNTPEATQQAPVNPQQPATPTGIENINWDEFKDANGKYLGKYNNPAEAVKGMHSLLHMAKTALSERDSAMQEVGQLRQRLTQPIMQLPAQQQPASATTDPLTEIEAKLQAGEGLDSDDALKMLQGIKKFTEERVIQARAQERQEQETSEAKWRKADDYMRQHHPRSLEFVNEMNLFKETNPEVGRVFNRLLASDTDEHSRTDATVYLWKEYSAANPHVLATPVDPAAQQQERNLNAQAQVRKEEVDQARTQAGLMGNTAGGARETEVSGTTQEDIERAANYMRQTADGRLWRELTIGQTLKGPFFDQ